MRCENGSFVCPYESRPESRLRLRPCLCPNYLVRCQKIFAFAAHCQNFSHFLTRIGQAASATWPISEPNSSHCGHNAKFLRGDLVSGEI